MHPELEKYAYGKSWVHRWNPSFKLFSLTCLLIALATLEQILSVLVGFMVVLGLLQSAQIPLWEVMRKLRWLLGIWVSLALLLPISLSWNATGFNLSWQLEGLQLAALIGLKAWAMTLLVFPMLGTAPLSELATAMNRLWIPNQLVQAFLFTYRYLFVYLDQLRKMRWAMLSRGFQPRFNYHSLQVTAYQVGMLLVLSYEQTERVVWAMKSRGFEGTYPMAEKSDCKAGDWLKLVLIIGLATGLIMGDRLWIP